MKVYSNLYWGRGGILEGKRYRGMSNDLQDAQQIIAHTKLLLLIDHCVDMKIRADRESNRLEDCPKLEANLPTDCPRSRKIKKQNSSFYCKQKIKLLQTHVYIKNVFTLVRGIEQRSATETCCKIKSSLS